MQIIFLFLLLSCFMTLLIWVSEEKSFFLGEGTKLDFHLSEMIKTNLTKALIGKVLCPTRIWPWAFTKLSWPCRLPYATFLCSFGVHDQRRRDVKLALQIAIRYVLMFFLSVCTTKEEEMSNLPLDNLAACRHRMRLSFFLHRSSLETSCEAFSRNSCMWLMTKISRKQKKGDYSVYGQKHIGLMMIYGQ